MNIKEIFAQARQVALYQEPKSGHVYIATFYGKQDNAIHLGDIRISQPLDVRFNPMPQDEPIHGAVAALDEASRKVRLDMQRQLDEIAERKSRLLAITFQPEVTA